VFLETLLLVIFWTWAFCAFLFLRNTFLPRLPITTSPSAWQLAYEPVRFQATDGVWLSGWKIARDPQQPWIILCHGLGANKADMLDIAAALAQAGYNLLAFDFRAHGESQGRTTSFGWVEQRDLGGALAFLGKQPDVPDRPYGILGISMGGAVAITVAARDERLGAIAVDSSYTDLGTSIGHHLKLLYHLPRYPFLFFTSSAYRLRFGIWPSRMAPINEITRISPRPVLIIQAEADHRIPPDQIRALIEAAREPKSLWIVPGAEHLGAYRSDPEGYQQRLVEFFGPYLKT